MINDEPRLYQRHQKNMGIGIMVLRDFSMGNETKDIPYELAIAAEMNAMHTDACKVYINRNNSGSPDEFRYSLGHRGIEPVYGHELIAEFEFISQQ